MSLPVDNPAGAIALVGIGCRFPGGVRDPPSFWRLLAGAVDAITEVPASRFSLERYFDPRPATPGRTMSRWGGFVDQLEEFDASFFGISPREAQTLDPQQRLLLEVAWEALEDAGQDLQRIDAQRTSVFVGQWVSDFESRLFADAQAVDFTMTTGSGRYASSGRLSYVLGFSGPSLTLDTACSSSLAAIHLAVRSIRSGESTLALAGGVNMILQPQISIAYSQSRMMAPDGRCKFGDAAGDGYVRSEGAALVVLKLLDRAVADGDRIYAVIAGSAVNNDGRSSGSMGTPSRVGQEALLRTAYRDAGIAPSRVGYVEAHGTGTRAGDPAELGALGAVLGEGRSDGTRALVGSVKTNFGHTEGAAGVAGLVKVALALHHGQIPPSLNCKTLNPAIDWANAPCEIARQATSWRGAERVGGVSAFGIAGTNAHVVLKSAPESDGIAPPATPSARPALLVLSGRSDEGLRALAARYADLLEAADGPTLRDVCWSAATRRTPLERRAAFVADDSAAMAAALRRFAAGEAAAAQGVVDAVEPAKIVFVLPGQGGQWRGMGRQLLAQEPVFRAALERCDTAARPYMACSITQQLETSPEAADYRLDEIDVLQPVLVALALAYAALWKSWGIEPDAVVGHSMGEVGAACLAGVLDIDQAMRIVCRRSALMRRTSGQGAMALVELSMDEARARIQGWQDRVSVAVSNSPRSSVISGEPLAVQQIMAELEGEQIFCRLVKIDVASHSPQMEPLAAELAAELVALVPHDAAIPICSTVLGRPAEAHEFGGEYWARNMCRPVLFTTAVTGLLDGGTRAFIELGPHPVLLPSVQQTAQSLGKEATTIACGLRDAPEAHTLTAALGALWAAGVPIDWQRALPGGGTSVALPLYPWQRERHWAETADIASYEPGARSARWRPDEESLGWLHSLNWRAADLPGSAGPATDGATRWLVVAEDESRALALAQALATAGGIARGMSLPALAEALAKAPESAGGGSPAPTAILAFVSGGESAARWPLEVLQAVLLTPMRQGGHGAPRLWFLTQNAQALDGTSDGRVSVNAAAAWGTARVVAEEHPELWGGLVDLDALQPLAETAPALLRHLQAGDGEDQVALRSGQRHVLRLAAMPAGVAAPDFAWRADAAYLVTGGLGGVGLHIAHALVARGVRHLVLLGRTPLPARELWSSVSDQTRAGLGIAAVRELEAAGVAVHVAAVDVADADQLQGFIDRWAAEARPPIRGVVHAAGTLANQLAASMDAATFDAVLRPKLLGALLLDRLFADLDLFVLISSTGAFLAQPGQANYAAANAGLDALASDRRGRGLPAHSLAWGVWQDTGLVRSEAGQRNVAEMTRQHIGSIAPERGAALFGWLVGQPGANTVVLPIDWAAWQQARGMHARALYSELVSGVPLHGDGANDMGSRLALASTTERRKLLEGVVRECLGQVLKVAPARLEPRRTFGSMGLTSLMAMEFRNRLEAALERPLSSTLAWNHPTVEALVLYLEGASPDTAQLRAAPPASAPGENLATRMADVAAMSDEEAARALRAGPKGRAR